jgi:hypothetical protein
MLHGLKFKRLPSQAVISRADIIVGTNRQDAKVAKKRPVIRLPEENTFPLLAVDSRQSVQLLC